MKPFSKFVGKPRKVWNSTLFRKIKNGPVIVEIYHQGEILIGTLAIGAGREARELSLGEFKGEQKP